MKSCLVAYIEDSFTRGQVLQIAEAGDFEVHFTNFGDQLSQLAKTLAPFLMLFDLSIKDNEWIFRHIDEIIDTYADLPVAVIVSPKDEAIIDRVGQMGCKAVISKIDVGKMLPDVIEKALRKSF